MVHNQTSPPAQQSFPAYWGSVLLLLVLFVFCWMDVIPFGDEVQQFPRALHTLDSSWLSNDLFVGAPQGDHWVFFRFVGGLFWLAGPVWGAVISRVLIWLLMAGALLSLGRALDFKPFAVIVGTALFIAYDQSRLGGETIVGEAIARHLAYPLVLFALGGWIRGRFLFAAAMLGCAASVHALVGLWAIVSILSLMVFDQRVRAGGWGMRFSCIGVCLLFSLPGLLPILPLVMTGHVPDAHEADQVFIYFRHPHHLSPESWPVGDYVHFVLMFGLFLGVGRLLPPSQKLARLRQFVWFVTIMTVIALAIGLTIQFPFFLKLHPYRFGPPLTSLLAALCVGQIVASMRPAMLKWVGATAAAALVVWLAPRGAYHLYRYEERTTEVERARLDALHWLKGSAPANASVLANPAWFDVQWESRRAAVSSFKLIPFEPGRIHEWYGRLTGIVGTPPWSQPGQVVLHWIQQAYDSLSTDHVLQSGEQLEADFTITKAPCAADHKPVYSNAHFCIHSRSQTATVAENYLVVRYDDYAPIAPYDGLPRNIETERRLFELAAKHNAKVCAGVIPFPIADQHAEPRDPSKTQPVDSWLGDASSPWVQLLRQQTENGVVEPALHGFEHRRRSLPGFRPGEFRRQPAEWQSDSIRLGRDAMVSALGRPIRVFVPPWNAWDATTVEALERLDFQWLSPDAHQAQAAPKGIKLAPQCTSDPVAALAAMQDERNSPPGTVLVLVTHPFDFEKPGGQGEAYYDALEEVFALADSSPRWSSVGFEDLPHEPAAQWVSRFRAAVQWNQAREMIEDFPQGLFDAAKTPMLYRPHHWYQDNLSRLRLPLIGAMLLSALAASLGAAVLAHWTKAAGLIANLGLVASTFAALYFAGGAWQIAQRDYAVRGLRWLAICAAAGAAIGFAQAVVRRRRSAHRYDPITTESITHDRPSHHFVAT